MTDFLYRPEDVSDDVRPIFDQLVEEFGNGYQIWRRVEDLGRWLSAGILDPETNVAVVIALRTAMKTRQGLLNESEIQIIHAHFNAGAQEDLTF